MNKRSTIALAMLAFGLLVATAVASPVLADPGSGHPSSNSKASKAQDQREQQQAQRESRKQAMEDAKDAWKACKQSNVTLNDTAQHRCMGEKSFFLNATHAAREAHALIGAIAALERHIGRLEVREHELRDQLAAGNLTENQTAEIQHKIDRIEHVQSDLVAKIHHLRERLAALHEKWQSVRDHVAERRHHGEDIDVSEPDDHAASESDTSTSA